jgi:CopG family nickel-responsive transcriptional regulator
LSCYVDTLDTFFPSSRANWAGNKISSGDEQMQRLTVTLDDDLVADIDRFIAERGYQGRSEAIRDLTRSGLAQIGEEADGTGDCVGVLTYVFDHHVRELSKRLAHTQHEHHDLSIATMHVHLDAATCLEAVLLKGKTRDVHHLAEHVIAERGVRYGRLVVVPMKASPRARAHAHARKKPSK